MRPAPPTAVLLPAAEPLLRALHAGPVRGGPRLLLQPHQPEHALHVRRGHGQHARGERPVLPVRHKGALQEGTGTEKWL